MQFVAHPVVVDRFPGLRLAVAVARGRDNGAERPAVQATWEATWVAAGAAARARPAQAHPRVHPWRERFRAAP